MSIVALFAWLLTIFGGLILLMIWIIEYDSEFQSAAATRLPVPVISAHALLGMSGMVLWLSYILADQERLAWASVAVLGTVAVLGLIMAARWIPRVPHLRSPRLGSYEETQGSSRTELPGAGRRRPRHPGRHHRHFGAVQHAWRNLTALPGRARRHSLSAAAEQPCVHQGLREHNTGEKSALPENGGFGGVCRSPRVVIRDLPEGATW